MNTRPPAGFYSLALESESDIASLDGGRPRRLEELVKTGVPGSTAPFFDRDMQAVTIWLDASAVCAKEGANSESVSVRFSGVLEVSTDDPDRFALPCIRIQRAVEADDIGPANDEVIPDVEIRREGGLEHVELDGLATICVRESNARPETIPLASLIVRVDDTITLKMAAIIPPSVASGLSITFDLADVSDLDLSNHPRFSIAGERLPYQHRVVALDQGFGVSFDLGKQAEKLADQKLTITWSAGANTPLSLSVPRFSVSIDSVLIRIDHERTGGKRPAPGKDIQRIAIPANTTYPLTIPVRQAGHYTPVRQVEQHTPPTSIVSQRPAASGGTTWRTWLLVAFLFAATQIYHADKMNHMEMALKRLQSEIRVLSIAVDVDLQPGFWAEEPAPASHTLLSLPQPEPSEVHAPEQLAEQEASALPKAESGLYSVHRTEHTLTAFAMQVIGEVVHAPFKAIVEVLRALQAVFYW